MATTTTIIIINNNNNNNNWSRRLKEKTERTYLTSATTSAIVFGIFSVRRRVKMSEWNSARNCVVRSVTDTG